MFRRITGKPPDRRNNPPKKTGNQFQAAASRYSDLSPQMNWHHELQRYLRAEARGDHRMIEQHLFRTTCYTSLISRAYIDGQRLGNLAMADLYPQAGADWLPLPHQPVPYSPESIIWQAVLTMGIPPEYIVFTDQNPNLDARRRKYSAGIHHEIHAWVYTNPDGRLPYIFVNLASPMMPLELQTVSGAMEVHPTPVWALHLALCLFALYDRWVHHVGSGVPGGEVMLPPFSEHHPDIVPIAHTFVKALCRLPERCPRLSPCRCNHILEDMQRVPPQHRMMTGTLPALSNGMHYARPARPTRPVTPNDRVTPQFHEQQPPMPMPLPQQPPDPTLDLRRDYLERAEPNAWLPRDEEESKEG